jgi:hypothetical protein
MVIEKPDLALVDIKLSCDDLLLGLIDVWARKPDNIERLDIRLCDLSSLLYHLRIRSKFLGGHLSHYLCLDFGHVCDCSGRRDTQHMHLSDGG